MSGEPNGGVYNPTNLGLYAYTRNNPVNLVDPDGENPKLLFDFAVNIAIAYAKEGKLTWSAVRGAAVDTVTDAFNPAAQLNKVKKLAKIVQRVSGNSRKSTKRQHLYEIRNTKTGETVKTGVSGGRIRKDMKSSRAESQVRKWNKSEGETGQLSRIYYMDCICSCCCRSCG